MSPNLRPIGTASIDPLGALASAMDRLRTVLPAASDTLDARRHDLVALAVGDVIRSLVLARRTMRALVDQVSELDEEGRDLIAIAARALALSTDADGAAPR